MPGIDFDQMLSPTPLTIGFDYCDSQSIGPDCDNEQARRATSVQATIKRATSDWGKAINDIKLFIWPGQSSSFRH